MGFKRRHPDCRNRVLHVESLSITVTSHLDTVANDGFTTLREAINIANASPGPDEIDFNILTGSNLINITGSSLVVADRVTITGTVPTTPDPNNPLAGRIVLVNASSTDTDGKIERWHQTIKQDCIRPHVPLSLEEARQLVGRFINDYNHRRLHSAVGYVTPADKLAGREQAIFDERDRKLAEARARRARNRQQARDEMTAA